MNKKENKSVYGGKPGVEDVTETAYEMVVAKTSLEEVRSRVREEIYGVIDSAAQSKLEALSSKQADLVDKMTKEYPLVKALLDLGEKANPRVRQSAKDVATYYSALEVLYQTLQFVDKNVKDGRNIISEALDSIRKKAEYLLETVKVKALPESTVSDTFSLDVCAPNGMDDAINGTQSLIALLDKALAASEEGDKPLWEMGSVKGVSAGEGFTAFEIEAGTTVHQKQPGVVDGYKPAEIWGLPAGECKTEEEKISRDTKSRELVRQTIESVAQAALTRGTNALKSAFDSAKDALAEDARKAVDSAADAKTRDERDKILSDEKNNTTKYMRFLKGAAIAMKANGKGCLGITHTLG